MGAWSHEPFGNDDASDWAYGLDDAVDLSIIENAFDIVLSTDGYLESPEASEAVAAAEVLAHVLGRGTQSDTYTEEVERWVTTVSAKPTDELKKKADLVLRKILSPESELRELWDESDDAEKWLQSIASLQAAICA